MSWEEFEPISFHADGGVKLNLLARMLGESGSNRIAPRRRPFRNGAKLDTTGANEDNYSFEFLFPKDGDVEEAGVTDDGGLPMYPDRLEALKAAFKTSATGTLNTLRQRGVRVKCSTWSISEVAEENRDGAIMSGTFLEDNEDSVDREAIVRPSARATMARRVDETNFDAEADGAWNPSLKDLTQAASDLAGLINAPNDYYGQIRAAGLRIRRAVEEIRTAFSKNVVTEILSDVRDADSNDTKFDDPESAPMRLRLMEMEELAARAELEAQKREPPTRQYYPERDTDIWKIAAELGQDAEKLSILNQADFEDLGNIPGGVAVRVYR